ncbi:MAG TPA: hypothetical protein VFS71_05720 [Flavobacterium sp.]|uniref:hypothetical protein n=1 Tax=Flavobacterium sp. TaxID=239 RepID=UPI002DBE4994|nr:hypothetical protein [Flavobacterium sp.]HEU4789163.1 hypothetical protein [Flavobacterium sp.]
MKVKLLLVLSLFAYQFAFSQTEKLLKGVVSSDNFLLQNVDVINKTSQKSTKTNDKGEFVVTVKANDSLLFYAKNYYLKRLKVSKEEIGQNNLQVVMIKKPEELDEVVVEKTHSIKLKKDNAYEQGKRDEIDVVKSVEDIKKRTVYDGAIDNGMNFIAIGKKILDLFRKEEEPDKEVLPEIEFATLAKNTCDQKFFTYNLKLKPDEIDLFLQFCDTDPKSKVLIEHHNVLSIMDFLSAKNIEFQKLKN